MKRFIACFAVLVLLFGSCLSETNISRSEYYAMGLDALYETDAETLKNAEEYFAFAGGYGKAKLYRVYAQSLSALCGELGSEALREIRGNIIELSLHGDFVNDLESMGYSSCDTILTYISAREHEKNGEYEEALQEYRSVDLLDSFERSLSLKNAETKTEDGPSPSRSIQDNSHTWAGATCTLPSICIICGETLGEPLGHFWQDATEDAPKTCLVCGATEGNPITRLSLGGEYAVGEYVVFGSYEQDGDESNGKEGIEWLVLDRSKDGYLLISRYALDCMRFNTAKTAVKWSGSSLRTWLNKTFYDAAFSAEEKGMIRLSEVFTPPNPSFPAVWGGFSTQDYVYLLSIQEADNLFSGNQARMCYPTEYAVSKGAAVDDGGTCWWWLRSPGNRDFGSAGVYSDGTVYQYGDDVNRTINGIRPVIRVSPEGVPETREPASELVVGGTYYFGSYEQNGNYSDGAERIAWRVLAIEDGAALLVSDKILDAYAYHELFNDTTWENCTLRVWLNNNFYHAAFSDSEKDQILIKSMPSDENPRQNLPKAGGATKDRVFILSASEINEYFTANYERTAYGTEYAMRQGIYINNDLYASWWWARTPGKTNKWAVRIRSSGEVDYEGSYVNSKNGGIRPAIWLSTY